ncbi:MAG: methyltransferase domain-containing protein [Ignavibacteria bacterium]|nr:methyltransferase domain-containing protein [Ignavibacteria bacterium]
MTKEWYKIWFSNKNYPELYGHRDENEARDLINLIQRSVPVPTDSKVLDVCCGAGRHSIELARRGYDVTGFDLSAYLIGQAKKELSRTNENGVKVKFLIRDMMDFNFKNKFDLAINIFSSFGYFEKDAENFKVFNNIRSSLKSGGYFVFDFLNEAYTRKNLVPYSEDFINGKKFVQKRYIKDGFVCKDIIIGKEKYSEKIRLFSPLEITRALISVGFEIGANFGDYYGSRFAGNKSKRLIIVSRVSD